MSELQRLMVLMITMGIVDLPSLKDYWSTSWPFCTPKFSKLLSCDCSFLLLKFSTWQTTLSRLLEVNRL